MVALAKPCFRRARSPASQSCQFQCAAANRVNVAHSQVWHNCLRVASEGFARRAFEKPCADWRLTGRDNLGLWSPRHRADVSAPYVAASTASTWTAASPASSAPAQLRFWYATRAGAPSAPNVWLWTCPAKSRRHRLPAPLYATRAALRGRLPRRDIAPTLDRQRAARHAVDCADRAMRRA